MIFRRALILVAIMVTPLVTAPLPAQQVVVCGADELFILDLATPTPRKVWSWRARERPELPEAMRGMFQTIAECKPSADGRRLLIASSSHGAVGRVRPSCEGSVPPRRPPQQEAIQPLPPQPHDAHLTDSIAMPS